VVEPIWRLRRAARPGGAWELEGGPGDVYLVSLPELAVFDFGGRFLDAVAALPRGAATVTPHRDREGDVAFLSVRIHRPHRLRYDGGFEVLLR
jgi:hypothetical protein